MMLQTIDFGYIHQKLVSKDTNINFTAIEILDLAVFLIIKTKIATFLAISFD